MSETPGSCYHAVSRGKGQVLTGTMGWTGAITSHILANPGAKISAIVEQTVFKLR